MEKSNEGKETERKLTVFLSLNLSGLEKNKYTPLELFEFHEQPMIVTFLITLTQFEKT